MSLFVTLALLFGGGGLYGQTVHNQSMPVVASGFSISTDGGKTNLTIALSKAVKGTVFVMEHPDRVIVDLPEVEFHVPTKSLQLKGGVISSFRYGLFAPGRSRVVIDLAQPALVSQSLSGTAEASGTAYFSLRLTKTDRNSFSKAATTSREASAQELPRTDMHPSEDPRPLVVIDPGHGGVDVGAVTLDGTQEKDIVFTFAKSVKKRLEQGGLYRVMMTRTEDVFVPLGERVRIAQAAKADLFISIHADSISAAPEVSGFTVYTIAERASDLASARLADRENQADAVAGIDSPKIKEQVVDILQELTLRETRAFSHRLAGTVIKRFETVMRMNKNPHRQAGFRVLRANDIPSVLIELGYLSSRKDIDLLTSDKWRSDASEAVSDAIDDFFATRRGK